MNSNRSPTAQEVMEFRAATGYGVMESKQLLRTLDPTLIQKWLEAAKAGGGLPGLHVFAKQSTQVQDKILEASTAPSEIGMLVDPIENDPALGPIISKVLDQVSERIGAGNDGYPRRGSCHLVWSVTKERLATEYGIEWLTPKEMNPGSHFS